MSRNTEPTSGRAIRPVHWPRGILRSSMRRVAGVVTTLIATLAVGVAPAYATTSGGIALYLSAPLVQGAEIDSVGTLTENFNGLGGSPTLDGSACPTALAIGTLSTAPSTAACQYRLPGIYGGAAATTSSPFFGGDGSNYFGTYSNSNAAITFTFPAGGVKYVGFWWSGGNRGNVVTFYNGATEIASLDTLALETLLGASPPSSWPSGNGSVTSMGGTAYPKGHYFGNPRGYTESPPLSQSAGLTQGGAGPYTEHRGYVYAYLNLFLTGDQTATSVKFSGNGFEFDNLTTSTLEQTPAPSLVFAKGLVGKTAQFLPGATDATGSMVAQASTTAASLSANRYERAGYTFTGWNTAENGTGTPYGAGANFNFATDLTLYAQWAGAPTVSTTSASATGYVVTVNGNVASANRGTISDRGFVYSTSVNPTVSDTKVTVGSAPFATGSFSGSTGALAAGTYYFRSFAVNEHGISYGASQTVVISYPISSVGFTETAVESGKDVGNTFNGGTSTVSGVNGVCVAYDDGGTVTGLDEGSTTWVSTDTYSRTNTTASAVNHSFLFFYDRTSSGAPADCNFVTNTANPSVRSSFLGVYPAGELSSDGTTATLVLNQAMTPIQSLPNAGWPGSLTYSVSPSLPNGVSLNTSTGEISGTPTAVSAATPYTITAVTPRSGSRGDINIWDATATITLVVQTASSGSSSGGSSSGSSVAPTPVVPAPTVTPRPTRMIPQTPSANPVSQPVVRAAFGFDPDAPARGTIGGVATNVSNTLRGSAGVSVVAGAFQFGVSLNGAEGAEVHTETPSRSPELFMPRAQSAAVSGSGSYPGSFVQLWLPNGTTSRELARIPVRSDGTFTSEVSFAAGSLEMPVPIGRQVLQVVGYDERGNQTVVDMTINIGQGAPAPEPNRQVGELPALAAGQSLATSGGMPETVSVTGLPDSGSVVVEGGGWAVSVIADQDNGVLENADGTVLVRLDQSSMGTTSGSGFLPGTLATVWLFSEPTLMATVTVDENGEFSSEFLVDSRLIAPGEHTLQIQGVGTDGYIKAANLGVLVEQPGELTTESASGLLWWALGVFALALVLVFLLVAGRRRHHNA